MAFAEDEDAVGEFGSGVVGRAVPRQRREQLHRDRHESRADALRGPGAAEILAIGRARAAIRSKARGAPSRAHSSASAKRSATCSLSREAPAWRPPLPRSRSGPPSRVRRRSGCGRRDRKSDGRRARVRACALECDDVAAGQIERTRVRDQVAIEAQHARSECKHAAARNRNETGVLRAARSPEGRRNFVYNARSMLRFLTAGESHGPTLVAIVEGVPAGLVIDFDQITQDLRRRQGGYGRGRRMAIESDRARSSAACAAAARPARRSRCSSRNKTGRTGSRRCTSRPRCRRGSTGARRAPGRPAAAGTCRSRRRLEVRARGPCATCSNAPARAKPPRASPPVPSPGSCCSARDRRGSHVTRIGRGRGCRTIRPCPFERIRAMPGRLTARTAPTSESTPR